MSQLNINTIKNKRGDYGPNLVGHSTVTGDLNVTGTITGVITGDGSGLTGLGNTANIKSDTISNSGIITATGFVGPLTGDVTGNVTGNLTGDVTGNITGTTGTFSGNVSVGGTLTYEDVTNVDSVGMITARKGIQVLADGINVVGVVTATSFAGDGSNLTNAGADGNVNVLTSNTTLSENKTYMINVSGLVLTLPSSPSTGDGINILNNVVGIHTIARNGSTIESLSEDMQINIQGIQFKIWYTGSTWSLF